MEYGNDHSSSLSFASSSLLSNGYLVDHEPPSVGTTSPELLSLRKLSSNLEKLVVDDEYHSYCDAEIEVDGISIGVHRCVLASRSPFFHELFKKDSDVSTKEGKPKYLMSQLVPRGRIGYHVFMTVLNYLYSGGKVKATLADVATCVDESCNHDACGPAIQYAVEMMYASSKFDIVELVQLVQRRLYDFVKKAFVEDVIPILKVAFHCNLEELFSSCAQIIAMSDLDDIVLEKELPYEVLNDVKSLRVNYKKQEEEHDSVQVDPLKEMRIRKIHKALDSNDIDLVKLLLQESDISLDIACALHYASAYCNPKIVTEVLRLGNANVNHRNSRGHTVLHVAARRKNLPIIVELLSKSASVSDTTVHGQTALTICKRLTCPKDYNEASKQGQETNKDRLCIDVLKRTSELEMSPFVGNMSVTSLTVADDLYMKLLLLENRVAMARTYFPTQARVAMHVADAASTFEFEFPGLSASKGSHRNFKEELIMSEIPSEQVKKLQLRLQALQKTVETGRRFFPSCSEFLDRLLEDDSLGALLLEKGTPEERANKHKRYLELKEELMEAFNKDMAANKLVNNKGFSSASSSSSSPKGSGTRTMHKVRRRKI